MIVDIYLTFQKNPFFLIHRKLYYYNTTAMLKSKKHEQQAESPTSP